MLERIMVPLDGSEAAEVVMPYTEEIAAQSGANITLVSVSDPTVGDLDHLYRSYLEHVSERMRRELKDWGAKNEADIPIEVLSGEPAAEILRYADEIDASLITMASRGGSGEEPWVLGNIASKVIQASSKPVLLIKTPASSTALQQKKLFKKILVPLDGSQIGEAAISHVQTLAGLLLAQVVLLHVIEVTPLVVVPSIDFAYQPVPPEVQTEKMAAAQQYLDSAERILKENGINTSSAVISGSPASEIIKYAEKNNVELIAMSTHGRSGIGRWVFGSVTEKVLHAGNAALLTVRAKE